MSVILGSGEHRYSVVENWAKLPDGWEFKDVAAVACDSKDRVYVFNRGEHPMMVFDRDGRLVLALGSAGGSAIITHVVKTLVAALDWNLDIQQAIALPNFGSRNGPTELEQGTAAADWAASLKALGHEVRLIDMTSGLHGIQRTRDGWSGGADPRREGVAIGD